MTAQLAAEGIVKRFGGVTALDGVTLEVGSGELVGLIGPNGSGKTTFLNVLSGFYGPEEGIATFLGRRITGEEPSRLASAGIARSFQVTKVFRRLSVLDNMLVPSLTNWSSTHAQAAAKARGILEELELDRLSGERAANLSGGQAKLLEFGRIMMLDPRLILLDEPFGGVHPNLKRLMHGTIRAWNGSGITIILISHDMHSIFDLCPRIVVLHNGTVIADDIADRVREDRDVLEAYLGDQHPVGHGES